MSDSSARLYSAGKIQVVIGLNWVPLNGELRKSDRNDLVAAAKEAGANHAAYYANQGAAFRLAGILPSLSSKDCQGKASAAAWLADVVERETIYVEYLPDGSYWIVGASPQSITLRTDRIVGPEKAGELLDDLLQDLMGGGDVVFDVVLGSDAAPPSGVLGSAREHVSYASFAQLVSGTPGKGTMVKQVVGLPPIVLFIVLGLGALALIVAAFMWWQKKAEQARIEAEQQAAAIAAQAQMQGNEAARKLQLENALKAALEADTATPDPDRLIQTCINAASTLTRTLGGWTLQNIACDYRAGTIVGQYNRKGGAGGRFATNHSLQQAAAHIGVPAYVQVAGEAATVGLRILDAQPRERLERGELPLAGEAANVVPSRLQWAEGAVKGFSAEVGDLVDRPIAVATDNTHQQQPPIPAEYRYLRGPVRISGSSLWGLNAVSYAWPFVSIDRTVLIPQPKGVYAWSLEGTYVARGDNS